jgi:hypothetical protein
MIVKFGKGSGITGLQNYIKGPGKDENGQPKTKDRSRLLGGQNFGFDVNNEHRSDIARRMMEYNASPQMQADKSRWCEKNSMHLSLSWARGQTPDDAEMNEAAKDVLNYLGMGQSRAVWWSHDDKSYRHMHLSVDRIDPETGRTYDDYQSFYKGMRWSIEWERKKNQITPSRQKDHDLADAVERQDYDRLKELLIKNEATIRRTTVDAAIAKGGKFGNEMSAEHQNFVQDQDLIRLKKYANGRTEAYTTNEIWQEEAKALGLARLVKEQQGFNVDDKIIEQVAKDHGLDEEQKEGLWHATRDNGLAMINGQAGSGKSRLMSAIEDAYDRSGRDVRGNSHTNQVVADMREAGIDSYTNASDNMRLKFHDPKSSKESVWKNKIIAIDEAPQLSTEQVTELHRNALKHGAKLIQFGDGRQLGSVEKGGLWDVMNRRFGATQLDDVKRNKDPNEKRAWNKAHERKFDESVDIWKKLGAIKWSDTRDTARKDLTEQYAKDFKENPDAKRLIITPTNEGVRALNDNVRDLWRNAGRLGKDIEFDTAKGKRNFAVGDRLVMNETSKNKTDKKNGLMNGAFGKIESIDQAKRTISVQLDNGNKFTLPVGMDKAKGQFSGIDHGYASTGYKSQGRTLDQSYVEHDSRATAPTNYVQMTRHRDKMKFYVSREETNGYKDLAQQLKHGPDKTSAHHYLVHDEDREKLQRAPERSREDVERSSTERHNNEVRHDQTSTKERNIDHQQETKQNQQNGEHRPSIQHKETPMASIKAEDSFNKATETGISTDTLPQESKLGSKFTPWKRNTIKEVGPNKEPEKGAPQETVQDRRPEDSTPYLKLLNKMMDSMEKFAERGIEKVQNLGLGR